MKKGVKQTWLAEKPGKSFSIVNSYNSQVCKVLFEIAKHFK